MSYTWGEERERLQVFIEKPPPQIMWYTWGEKLVGTIGSYTNDVEGRKFFLKK